MDNNITNTQRYRYLSAVFAFFLWGGWAFYVNYMQAGWQSGLLSGIVQGVCSFVITLFIAYLVEKQFNWYEHALPKLLLPPICTVLLTGSCLILIHTLIQTPNIFKTLLPVLTVAFLFAVVTNFKLYQQHKIIVNQ